jgi:hypothetical protein
MASSNPDIATFEALSQQDASLKWFAIADSAQDRALPAALVQQGYRVCCLFGSPQGSPIAQHAPHLVELGCPLDHDRTWSWISLTAKSKPCVSIIATRLNFDELFRQLAECTAVELPDGEQMFFAYWDPAILGTLMGQPDDLTLHVTGPVLDLSQRSILVRGMAGWWYWDRAGAMHSVIAREVGKATQMVPIRLNQQQVDELVEASVPDHLLYYLESNQSQLISQIPRQKRYAFVRETLSYARDFGLVSMRDLVDFLCLGLVYQTRLQEDPIIQGLLTEVKQGRLEFREAFGELA